MEINKILNDGASYVIDAFMKVKPALVMILSVIWYGISYVLFPDGAYLTAACAVGGAIILDIVTKYYALSRPHKSVILAIRAGTISSSKFYEGTKRKLISFLVLMILCGLSVRVVPVSGVAVFAGSIIYSVLFLR